MRFELLDGKHVTRKGEKFIKGDVVESDVRLDEVFGEAKFRKMMKGEVTRAQAKAADARERKARKAGAKIQLPSEDEESEEDEAELEAPVADLAARGKDHSDEFKRAIEHELEVLSRGGRYHVYRKGTSQPLNSKGLAKNEVNSFIKEFMDR